MNVPLAARRAERSHASGADSRVAPGEIAARCRTRRGRSTDCRATERSLQTPPRRRTGMEDLILDENEELLSPVVVVATVALIGVFVLGGVYRLVGLLL